MTQCSDNDVDRHQSVPSQYSAATLDDVVIHYVELCRRVSTLNPTPALLPIRTTDGINPDCPNVASERAALVAYLKKLK